MNTQAILVTAYIDNQDKRQALYDTLKKIKGIIYNSDINYKIILSSHSPIDIDIQKMVDYFVYDNDNEMITIPMYWWAKYNDFEYHINDLRRSHSSYAHFTLIKQGVDYINNLGIEVCHYLNYDIPIVGDRFFTENNSKIKNGSDAVFYKYDDDNSTFKYGSLNSCMFSVNTKWFSDMLDDIKTSDDYLEMGDYENDHDTRLVLESFLYKLLPNVNEIVSKKEWDDKYGYYGTIKSEPNQFWLLNDKESFYVYCNNTGKTIIDKKIIINGFDEKVFSFTPQTWYLNKLGDINNITSIQIYDSDKLVINEIFEKENLKYHLDNHKLIWTKEKKF